MTDMNRCKNRTLFAAPPSLRYPAFRRYWFGTLAAVNGFQILRFAELWLVHELTGSPLFLGYVGLANAAPAIGLNLFGGVLADKLDKRRLIMTTQVLAATLVFALATLTVTDVVRPWHVMAIAFLAGIVEAFDGPAHEALYPHLVDRKAIMSAVALDSAIWQGTRIVAPAIAGFIIAMASTAAAFYVAGFGFLTMAVAVYTLKPPPIPASTGRSAVGDLIDGLRFLARNSIFSFLIGMTFFNSFFGLAYVMLMPVIAVDVLGVDADGQGILMSTGGAGAIIVTLGLGSVNNFGRRGMLVIGGATVFGLALAAFALTTEFVGSYSLALVLMFTMGVFNSAYMISVMSSLQIMVPDNMRGRVMGIFGMTWSFMPLGGMQAGAVAHFIGAPYALAIGGFAVAAFALGPALIYKNLRSLGTVAQVPSSSSTTSEP
ncbi:MAG: MFS transporter [SAR202 cluster bacterium]|nr:MFS transporter [SAR202 cluster bacterium]